MATTLLTIGEFSRMTHLSVKALRHYHDVGVLAPAAIDPSSGYRSYDTGQVASAQVIRRLRDLGMPLDSIAAVLSAPDVAQRNREIAAHLERMERQLEETQAAVSSLRALLSGVAPRPMIQFRTIPAVTALAIAEVVRGAEVVAWGAGVFAELEAALAATGLEPAGPFGALFPGEFFEITESEVTVFAPVVAAAPGQQGQPGLQGRHVSGRVHLREVGGIEAAVAMHPGPASETDRTYGAIGTVVAERAIGVDGPIREYYPDGFDPAGDYRTEICWPVFLTGLPG
ncbi:MerR family transcriptional regulator [Trebonia kvetii]|uniref:MerR family transcriptional regulator n=1 Tax=Trebonia kvetii TaxID=2480626 RepID=A0A6P2BWJ9_9ACTN|nr:MerR family transcriptional regulator [Trebonia kvetii]TVZ03434.1 MerR family transcriptional regulator [Trebonia kvetii]